MKLKKKKKMPGDIIIIEMCIYNKYKSYHIWFLRYGAQKT